MPRVKGGVVHARKRKRLFKRTKGFQHGFGKLYRPAKEFARRAGNGYIRPLLRILKGQIMPLCKTGAKSPGAAAFSAETGPCRAAAGPSGNGRGRGTRTPGLRFWRPPLYQLSYTPIRPRR